MSGKALVEETPIIESPLQCRTNSGTLIASEATPASILKLAQAPADRQQVWVDEANPKEGKG